MGKSAEERARHCASDLRDADVVNWIDQLAAIPIIAAAIREDRAEPVSEAEVEAACKSVPLDDLLFAYRGLMVLKTMLRKVGLSLGVEATDEILERLDSLAPELPGLSALRKPPAARANADEKGGAR